MHINPVEQAALLNIIVTVLFSVNTLKLLHLANRRMHTIQVVSNLLWVLIAMPCDFRIWALFCCGWHTWPRSHTTSLGLNIVQLS